MESIEERHWQIAREYYGDETFDALFMRNPDYDAVASSVDVENGVVNSGNRLYKPRSFLAFMWRSWPMCKKAIAHAWPMLQERYARRKPLPSPFVELAKGLVESAAQYVRRQ